MSLADTRGRGVLPWHIGGAVAFLCFATLSWVSRHPTAYDVWLVLGCLLVAWAAVIGLYCSRWPVSLSALWVWALLLRVAGFCGEPLLEDDWYRYLWDGRLFALSGNPYGEAPAAFFDDPSLPSAFANILSLINYPDVPTIYGPVCQYLFLLGYWIDPAQLWPLKLGLVVGDLVTLRILLRLVTPRQAALYAWCPLLIFETVLNAHPESFGICFLVGAMACAQQKRWFWMSILLALATTTRVFALVLVPLFLVRRPVRYMATFVLGLAVLYAPFWIQGSAADFSVLSRFAAQWEFNSSIYALASWLVGGPGARWVCWAIFGMFYLWYARRFMKGPPGLPRGDWVLGVFFLVSPVLNPWYLLWLLPFIAVYPSVTGITALAVVSLSYLQGMNLGTETLQLYQHPAWLRPVEFGAIFLAGLWDWRRTWAAEKGTAGPLT